MKEKLPSLPKDIKWSFPSACTTLQWPTFCLIQMILSLLAHQCDIAMTHPLQHLVIQLLVNTKHCLSACSLCNTMSWSWYYRHSLLVSFLCPCLHKGFSGHLALQISHFFPWTALIINFCWNNVNHLDIIRS